jgi:glycosyltransferase involved in cell wall biosynthesis
MGRSILIVAQLSPPSQMVAARRVAGLAKYLSRLGHSVTVLTSVRSGRGAIAGAVRTLRTPDLAATGLNWRTTRAGPVAPTGAVRGIEAHVVPDIAAATWLPFALPAAGVLARRGGFDCAITTSPPASTHLLGPMLQRRGVRWIADFRDGWTFDAPRPPWPLRWERRLDAALERATMRRADAAFAVTRPIVQDLRDRLGVDARLLTNGYDPEERPAVRSSWADGLLSFDRHSLVHTGRAGVSGRSPAPVLEALKLLLQEDPGLSSRFEAVFAGPLSADELRLFSDPALRGIVRAVGAVPRRRALALQQVADSLLVVAAGASERSVATGKLFEYLTAGPPILVVGDRSEAARIVRETGTGSAVPAERAEAVADGIRELLSGRPTERNSDEIDSYSWEVLAKRASALVDEVCTRPETRPRRKAGYALGGAASSSRAMR